MAVSLQRIESFVSKKSPIRTSFWKSSSLAAPFCDDIIISNSHAPLTSRDCWRSRTNNANTHHVTNRGKPLFWKNIGRNTNANLNHLLSDLKSQRLESGLSSVITNNNSEEEEDSNKRRRRRLQEEEQRKDEEEIVHEEGPSSVVFYPDDIDNDFQLISFKSGSSGGDGGNGGNDEETQHEDGPQSLVFYIDDDEKANNLNANLNEKSSESESTATKTPSSSTSSTPTTQILSDTEQESIYTTGLDGEVCHIEHHDNDKCYKDSTLIDDVLIYLPIIIPISAYNTYEETARLFNQIVDVLNINRKWVPVDGGAYQAQIITPAINGIVVPSISILFASLISNTISTLRQRQLDVRTALNMEAANLRVLSSMVDSFPPTEQKTKCRTYLTQYTCRLIAESQADVKINSLEFTGSTDSEMNAFLETLNELILTKKDIPGPIISESFGAITRLNSERSARITALQSTFPMLQYTILAALAVSICLTFLIESNQEIVIFLNALQLRVLWTMLIGTFSALGIVIYDLSDPFRGSYQITNAVDQFYIIRDSLRASSAAEEASGK